MTVYVCLDSIQEVGIFVEDAAFKLAKKCLVSAFWLKEGIFSLQNIHSKVLTEKFDKNWCVHNRRENLHFGWLTIVRFGKSLEKQHRQFFGRSVPYDFVGINHVERIVNWSRGDQSMAANLMNIKYLNFKLSKHLICWPFASKTRTPSGCANDQNFKVTTSAVIIERRWPHDDSLLARYGFSRRLSLSALSSIRLPFSPLATSGRISLRMLLTVCSSEWLWEGHLVSPRTGKVY